MRVSPLQVLVLLANLASTCYARKIAQIKPDEDSSYLRKTGTEDFNTITVKDLFSQKSPSSHIEAMFSRDDSSIIYTQKSKKSSKKFWYGIDEANEENVMNLVLSDERIISG